MTDQTPVNVAASMELAVAGMQVKLWRADVESATMSPPTMARTMFKALKDQARFWLGSPVGVAEVMAALAGITPGATTASPDNMRPCDPYPAQGLKITVSVLVNGNPAKQWDAVTKSPVVNAITLADQLRYSLASEADSWTYTPDASNVLEQAAKEPVS